MADRLRALLDRPLDPATGRAILALATAVFLGFAALVAIGVAGHATAPRPAGKPPRSSTPAAPAPAPAERDRDPAPRERRQDPQDRRGSSAARRAAGTLRAHRALQHVPYRRSGLAIELVGARGGRAVLRVRAASASAARQGWRRFLHRYRDSGHSYIPRFKSRAGGANG